MVKTLCSSPTFAKRTTVLLYQIRREMMIAEVQSPTSAELGEGHVSCAVERGQTSGCCCRASSRLDRHASLHSTSPRGKRATSGHEERKGNLHGFARSLSVFVPSRTDGKPPVNDTNQVKYELTPQIASGWEPGIAIPCLTRLGIDGHIDVSSPV